jgi:4-hydroxy-tetrahydrodipicolinate synthase
MNAATTDTRRTPSTFVISITPFDDEERFDAGAFRDHCRRLADGGIGTYVVGGGSGEAYTLTQAETAECLQIAVEEMQGRVPVRAMGTEPRSALQMIEFARLVSEHRLDAMQVYSLDMGHGFAPSDAELERYFSDVLSATEVPAILSTHSSVGYLVPVPLLVRLAEQFPHVIGVNATSPDVTYVLRLIDALDPRIDLHVGGPMQAMGALSLGASGYLSSEGNIAPRLCTSVVDRFAAGDLAGAADAYQRLMRLFAVLVAHGGTRATKAALGILELPGGITRRPRLPLLDDAALTEIAAVLDEIEIRRIEGLEPEEAPPPER